MVKIDSLIVFFLKHVHVKPEIVQFKIFNKILYFKLLWVLRIKFYVQFNL